MHQYHRSTRQNNARQFSQHLNLIDILIKANTRSDPVISSFGESARKVCSNCKKKGHNIRTCTAVGRATAQSTILNYFVEDMDPVSLEHKVNVALEDDEEEDISIE